MWSLEVCMLLMKPHFWWPIHQEYWLKTLVLPLKRYNEWLGKSVVITCDDVNATQLPKVLEHEHQATGVESIVFNMGLDEIWTESIPSVCSRYQSYQVAQLCWGHQVPHYLTKYQTYNSFLALNERRTLYDLNSGSILFQMPGETFLNSQYEWAAINKFCVGDAADAISCLWPGVALGDIIEKFKWLHGSVELFDLKNLNGYMDQWNCLIHWCRNSYRIIQGKSKRVQAFVLCLEQALKVIKQQHPHAMTEEEGQNHLKA